MGKPIPWRLRLVFNVWSEVDGVTVRFLAVVLGFPSEFSLSWFPALGTTSYSS